MNQLHYFEAEDVLHFLVAEGEEPESKTVAENYESCLNQNSQN